MVKDMIIPLSRQAIDVLHSQHAITGQFEQVFYSDKAKGGIISDNTAGKTLNDLGYQGIHCPHGFRATAKTFLMQYLGYHDVITEMALGHITKAPNGTAYARYDFLDDRIGMMSIWADYLDALRQGKDTTRFKAVYREKPTDILHALIDMIGKDKLLKLINHL